MPDNNLDKHFLASIVETSNESIITFDLDMAITSWNAASEDLYGYPASETIGKSLTSLTLPKNLHTLLEKLERIAESKENVVFESQKLGKDDDHVTVEVVVSPIRDEDGKVIGVSTVSHDLTAKRRAEKALHDKDVLQRLIIAKEDERSRISRDLHDELGQEMTTLRFALGRAKAASKDDSTGVPIEMAIEIARDIDNSLDFLAWELRPALLDGVGILSAVENYLTQWSRHAGVEIVLHTRGLKKKELSPTLETNLYRIVQESLNNIHKHANAKSVTLTLEKRGRSIVLIIEDDGSGFDVESNKEKSRGLGLTGMRERSTLIGGKFEIDSDPKRGTKVCVKVPVPTAKNGK